MKKPTSADRHGQALHALNCAVACLVAWPPTEQHLGGAIYFAALALHRMAQADPDGSAGAWAEKYLEQARQDAVVAVPAQEEP
ncbi:MAG TPA: hypothetical protein VLE97_06400 [Gaiellaceae bacterium]|nr:hypothetical protein [Gaiellaceae bacterium]